VEVVAAARAALASTGHGLIYNDSNQALSRGTKKPWWCHGSVTLNHKMAATLADHK
jgi:hypothetical protein